MIRFFFTLVFILGLISCQPSVVLSDYLEKTSPGDIPIVFAPDFISIKGRLEHGISFTPDMQELAFGILDKDGIGEILHSENVSGAWTEPMIFESLKNEIVYLPYFSPDGKSLLYANSKSDSDSGYITDIWMIEKIDDKWGSPQKIEAPLSSISREANASMTDDGTIYFSSNRNCEGQNNCFTADLFYSKLIDKKYQSVVGVSDLNSPLDEESVFISPKEDYIIFCRYVDNQTNADLFISYRDYNNNWLEPQILDPTINSKYLDRRPFVSIDNELLFFTRLQVKENTLTESDIYWVSTSKIFKPYVYHPLPEPVLLVGNEFELSIPDDYFKDLDDKQLTLSINQSEFDWLEFDSDKMTLSGLPTQVGDFELIFTAVDKYSNAAKDKITVTVMK